MKNLILFFLIALFLPVIGYGQRGDIYRLRPAPLRADAAIIGVPSGNGFKWGRTTAQNAVEVGLLSDSISYYEEVVLDTINGADTLVFTTPTMTSGYPYAKLYYNAVEVGSATTIKYDTEILLSSGVWVNATYNTAFAAGADTSIELTTGSACLARRIKIYVPAADSLTLSGMFFAHNQGATFGSSLDDVYALDTLTTGDTLEVWLDQSPQYSRTGTCVSVKSTNVSGDVEIKTEVWRASTDSTGFTQLIKDSASAAGRGMDYNINTPTATNELQNTLVKFIVVGTGTGRVQYLIQRRRFKASQ